MPDPLHLKALRSAVAAIFIIALMGLSSVNSFGQTVISKLEFKGQPAESVEITVIRPKQKPTTTIVKLKDPFSSGTIFQIPSNTVVYLTHNSNSQRLGPGSKHQVTLASRGESHKTFFGTVTHYVNKVLDFYNASGSSPKYQAAVEGTVFSVESVGKDVKIETSEGRVAVQRKVPCVINEPSQAKRKKEREITTTRVTYLNAGDAQQTFDHDSDEEITYATYREAIADYERQLDRARQYNPDAEYLVDDYVTLGELYLDMGDFEDAIVPLEKAQELFDELYPEDPFVTETYLNLAEAYYALGEPDSGDEYWDAAVGILEGEVEYYLDDYYYFREEGDDDTAWSIGQDLVDMYDNLGWAYEIEDDDALADEYYRKAEELEEELEEL